MITEREYWPRPWHGGSKMGSAKPLIDAHSSMERLVLALYSFRKELNTVELVLDGHLNPQWRRLDLSIEGES
jgi:hypothetical protein